MDSTGDEPVSFLDWKSKASRRVLHSTFGAETGAALETLGMAKYFRAYMCDVILGASQGDVMEYDETHMPIVLYTDCRSLYDHLKKEGSVPEDKWVAVWVGSLRCGVSAGPDRNKTKSECKWVASRWQLADGLTKFGLAKTMYDHISRHCTRLHELSLHQFEKAKTKPAQGKTSSVHYCCYVASGLRQTVASKHSGVGHKPNS